MHKYFYLARSYDMQKGQPAIDDLNRLLSGIGVIFSISETNKGKQLDITVDEDKLRKLTAQKSGRPKKYDIDYQAIQERKMAGETDKQIYTSLGMSRSLYYLRMREYKMQEHIRR